jgi:hypothetical protein
MSKAIIAAGQITDEAMQHLRTHGAVIERVQGLTIIEVPDNADMGSPGYQGVQNEYSIAWQVEEEDEQGKYYAEPDEWVEVHLYIDASKTRVSLARART